jgi:hypothetical protein
MDYAIGNLARNQRAAFFSACFLRARPNTVHLIRFFDVWPEESAFWLAREICARDSLTFFVSRLLGSNVPFDQGAEYRGFLRAIAPSSE